MIEKIMLKFGYVHRDWTCPCRTKGNGVCIACGLVGIVPNALGLYEHLLRCSCSVKFGLKELIEEYKKTCLK